MRMSLPQNTQREEPRHFGKVLLLSSGEIAPSGRKMHERLFLELDLPINVAILETPAGFELNSALVAKKVGDFLETSLRNFSPNISIIPARHNGGPFSTNSPNILKPMLDANYFFLGAGSPTYVAHQLKDSLGLNYLVGRHRMGATLCLASASAMAFGSKVVPVYEIFKAGHSLHWIDGLDFFGQFGLDLAIVSHWDNSEGGINLDTSHCFMGRSRMDQLRKLLPPTTLVLGIDEHTGVLFDFETNQCQVLGKGKATIMRAELMETYETGTSFPIELLGPYSLPPQTPGYGPPVGEKKTVEQTYALPPKKVLNLLQEREKERTMKNWIKADEIRNQIASMGFEIQDTEEGPQITKV